MSPGPPPVATVVARPGSTPGPAAATATYQPLPRASAWPPMTPTTERPTRCRASAASMVASWTARADGDVERRGRWRGTSRRSPGRRCARRASGVQLVLRVQPGRAVRREGDAGNGRIGDLHWPRTVPASASDVPSSTPVPAAATTRKRGSGRRAADEQIPPPRGAPRPARRARQGRNRHLRRSTATSCRSTSTSSMAIRPSTSWWSRCSPSSTAGSSASALDAAGAGIAAVVHAGRGPTGAGARRPRLGPRPGHGG